jgi:hypothetical protein
MVGGYSGTITSSNVRTGIAAVGDPPAYLQAPAIGSCNATYPSGFNKSSGAWTLSAGTYCGGITVSGSARLTLNLGTYVLKGGGLNLAGNAVLTGTGGVTFYNTGTSSTYKPITMTNDSGSVNLAAPTTGPLAGILFFQDRAIISTAVNLIGGALFRGPRSRALCDVTTRNNGGGTARINDQTAGAGDVISAVCVENPAGAGVKSVYTNRRGD